MGDRSELTIWWDLLGKICETFILKQIIFILATHVWCTRVGLVVYESTSSTGLQYFLQVVGNWSRRESNQSLSKRLFYSTNPCVREDLYFPRSNLYVSVSDNAMKTLVLDRLGELLLFCTRALKKNFCIFGAGERCQEKDNYTQPNHFHFQGEPWTHSNIKSVWWWFIYRETFWRKKE